MVTILYLMKAYLIVFYNSEVGVFVSMFVQAPLWIKGHVVSKFIFVFINIQNIFFLQNKEQKKKKKPVIVALKAGKSQ